MQGAAGSVQDQGHSKYKETAKNFDYDSHIEFAIQYALSYKCMSKTRTIQ